MVFRITTWNVNGIRNPFGYQPWRDKRTFDGMFDILEADIVIMQELKIQRKDLRDDMVLVPGWDCYFSLPRHKKGLRHAITRTSTLLICRKVILVLEYTLVKPSAHPFVRKKAFLECSVLLARPRHTATYQKTSTLAAT